MSKNANGEGSIYKRTRNGKAIGYAGALTYLDESGTSKRHTVYGRTRAEVREKLKAARDRLDAGAPVRDASRTVGDWMRQWRSTTLAASDRKESTQDLYSNLSRRHLEVEPFGTTRLDRLKPSDIEALILSMRAQTKVRGGETVRALSDSTIRQVYTVLRAGLDGAVRDGLVAVNPAVKVKRPGIARQEAKHLPADAVQQVLTTAASSRYHPALVLIAATGLRKGEALGLSWQRVDLEAGTLTVLATLGRIGNRLVISEPKTARSRRTVPLSPAVVAMLRRHKAAQAEERLRAGNQWQDSGLVFTTEFGGPVDPRNLLRVLEAAAAAAGVDKVGVHTLRHSAAVAWLESGVHIKAVADLLGHSSIAITGDVYGHTSDDTARSAVAGLSEALGL
ncbi:site-specific integrase [Gordonia sp. UCD-TK1]|uniref:tyrosine-type recombinase/integrase n=1 Tax=Gordonia sp. UCD-TK1 TaxID=1857893 RepID=UPI00080E1EAB|nr:site-specific integrase [Gordonia sp. UCD-TK1]OCH82286.1 integrase [Gordonia sp. UCD-TK1]